MSNSVYEQTLERFGVDKLNKLHPLILAILKEASESAEKAETEDDKVTLTLIAFATNIPLIKGMLDSCFKQADVINLNYRDESFQISEKSEIYQQLQILSEKLPEVLH